MRLIWSIALALGLAACVPQGKIKPEAAHETAESRGEAFAKAHCARCHAMPPNEKSRYKRALPLRKLAAEYDLAKLGDAFAAGIKVAHRGNRMPVWQLTSNQVDDLIAYLKLIGG